MQESMYRMSGQVQAMQQEVRELAQMAQQLQQQHLNHFQQLQGQANQNTTMYQMVGHEQSSAQLLKYLTEICTEMNSHLSTISQQMSSGAGQGQNQGQNASQGMMQSSGGVQSQKTTFTLNQNAQQKQAAAGPIATDTTHFNHAAVPGMDRRMTSQFSDPSNNQMTPAPSTGMGAFNAVGSSNQATMSATQGMQKGGQMQGSQMTSGAQNQGAMAANQGMQQGGQMGSS
ncbi:MAG: hypothetical protein ACXVPC_11250, partial [Tumebacillaceae bacterium]